MLSVDSLSKSFGETQVLKNISLDIPDGETTVILGPSGSGKSTLLGLFNGLTHPDEGIVRVNGVDTLETPSRGSTGARGNSPGAFEGVGMLFAQPEAQLIMPPLPKILT